MPVWIIIPVCILVILIIIFVIADIKIGNYFYEFSMARYPKVAAASGKSLTKKGERPLTQRGELRHEWLDEVPNEELCITSFDGLALYGVFVPNGKPEKIVILCHGYKNNPLDMCYPATKFYERGFSCFIPYARGHAKSEGNYIGMGWHERLDILKWIALLNEKYNSPEIVLYGISMGASTVMNVSGEDVPENVKCAVEDCGYSSIKEQFYHVLKNLKNLPSAIIFRFASHAIKRNTKINVYREGFTTKQLAKSKLPVFFVQGDDDRFVPYSMLKVNYDAHPGPKDILTIHGAAHAACPWVGGDLYWNSVFSFIDKYITLKPEN